MSNNYYQETQKLNLSYDEVRELVEVNGNYSEIEEKLLKTLAQSQAIQKPNEYQVQNDIDAMYNINLTKLPSDFSTSLSKLWFDKNKEFLMENKVNLILLNNFNVYRYFFGDFEYQYSSRIPHHTILDFRGKSKGKTLAKKSNFIMMDIDFKDRSNLSYDVDIISKKGGNVLGIYSICTQFSKEKRDKLEESLKDTTCKTIDWVFAPKTDFKYN